MFLRPIAFALAALLGPAWFGGAIGVVGVLVFSAYIFYEESRRSLASRRLAESTQSSAYELDALSEDPNSGVLSTRLQPVGALIEELMNAFDSLNTDLRNSVQRERSKTLQVETSAVRLEESEEKFRKANDELEALASAANQHMAGPLLDIERLANILLEDHGHQVDDIARKHLETARTSVERMIAMLEELVILARMRPPTREDAKHVEIGTLVSRIVEDRQTEVPDNARVVVGGSLPTLEAPPDHLRQILESLITNGIKHNDSDDPTVTLQGLTEGNLGVIRIKDNGIGIPEHLQESSFGLFTRLHADRGTPGTGAGLAIARRAVRSLGGELWIESSSAAGTTFVVAIPTYFSTGVAAIQWKQAAGGV